MLMLTVDIGLSNVLFYPEIRSDVPPDCPYLLSFQLLINQEAVN